MSKKIMFNDRYRLTEAVLSGRKTQTRRIITCPNEFKGEWVAGFYVYKRQSDNAIIQWPCMYDADERTFDGGEILPKYKVGEVVAIAQCYADLGFNSTPIIGIDENGMPEFASEAGMYNKMFVLAALMPHRIRITNVRVERLQDISDEDCIKEGIEWDHKAQRFYVRYDSKTHSRMWFAETPREAYAALIDRISGKGTWDSNPYVFPYDFELVK